VLESLAAVFYVFYVFFCKSFLYTFLYILYIFKIIFLKKT
jgi:hypothetical protein